MVMVSIRRLDQIPNVSLSSEAQNQVLFFDGTNWTNAANRTIPITAVKTSDETRTESPNFIADSELTIPVEANSKYAFLMCLWFNSNPAADFKYSFSIPVGALDSGRIGGVGAGTFESQQEELIQTWSDNSAGVTTSAADSMLQSIGTLETGANAGNFTLLWAQITDSVEDTTVLENSWIMLTQLA